MSHEAEYSHFASRISFFDFREDLPEFKKSDFEFEGISEITDTLRSRENWNSDALASFVRERPMSFKVLEGIFQQLRFTNPQLANFAFDVKKLNSPDPEVTYSYAIQNLTSDPECLKLFGHELPAGHSYLSPSDLERSLGEFSKESVVAYFKITVSEYIEEITKDFELLANRITNPRFKDVSERFARYVTEVLRLNNMLNAVDPAKYLKEKLVPVDTKSLHGKYAKVVLQSVLERHEFVNLDGDFQRRKISTFDKGFVLNTLDSHGRYFCTEKSVKGILTDKGRPKRFDIVLFAEGKPRHLFEVNFYSTGGTKIGINESEYVALNDEIKKRDEYKFHWITDGNYWLTKDGKERYLRLVKTFGDVYNINTFEERLQEFT